MKAAKGLGFYVLVAGVSALVLLTGWIFDIAEVAGEVLGDLATALFEQLTP